MNDTVYVDADFTLPPGLPQPGTRDLAEVFGESSGSFDHDKAVRPVPGQQGTWRAGVKSCDSSGMSRRHPGQISVNGSDFYFK